VADLERHVPALDGIRAVAVTEVFVYHAYSGNPSYKDWAPVRLGHLGVEAFFVLSGFLITLRLFAADADLGLSVGSRWRTFLLRRTARVFPVYYATLLGLALAGAAFGFAAPRGAWVSLVTYSFNVFMFLHGWAGAGGHLWSLSVEEQFYLFFPALVLTRARRWMPALVAIGALASVTTRVALAGGDGRAPLVFLLTPLQLHSFGAGILCAVCIESGRGARALRAASASALVAFVGIVFLSPGGPRAEALLSVTLSVVTAGLILALWLGRARFAARLLGARWVAGLGRISYGVYLFHVFVIFALWKKKTWWLLADPHLRGLAAFALTVVLAYLSWRFFERPILQWARRSSPPTR
jgi:peptidoglycan/LPS O-acetylase OafA/YrhL